MWVSELRKNLNLCFLLLLVSCQSVSDSSHITEEDVVKVLQESGIVLVEADFPRGNASKWIMGTGTLSFFCVCQAWQLSRW
jgi:hypothetical protein